MAINRLKKLAKGAMVLLAILAIVWICWSWLDVLANQWDGADNPYNLFNVLKDKSRSPG